jgi:DNA replication protein DnaC
LAQLDRTELLICDELGYLSFSRAGAELLFQVFADRYEWASLLVTSNLQFSEWHQIFLGEQMPNGPGRIVDVVLAPVSKTIGGLARG